LANRESIMKTTPLLAHPKFMKKQAEPQLLTPAQVVSPQSFALSPERTVHWMGGVNYQNLSYTMDRISELLIERPSEAIKLVVTSHGGCTGVGMSFYDSIRRIYKPKLITIGTGDVDSSGIIIFLAGEKRYLTPNTTMLLHMAGRTFDNSKRHTVKDMESMIREDKIKDEQYAAVVAERSGGKLTVGEVFKLMRQNTILTPEQAIELGLAHGVI
jgi:ATP-dependent Clp protease, protease subunit